MSRRIAIDSAVSEIINTRDMCGDEQQVIRDVQSDFGIKFSDEEKREIWSKVNGTWKESQVAAGAKILTSHERARACAALEDDEWGDPDEHKDWTPDNARRLRMNHARNCSNFEE